MGVSTKESGTKTTSEKAKELKSGRTASSSSDTGRRIKLMGRAELFKLTEMFMKGSGLMIGPMEWGTTNIKTEHATVATGRMIDNMVTESKHGQIVLNMKVTTSTERSKVSELSTGEMALLLSENSTIITYMGREFILGQTKDDMKENGE